MSVQEEDEDGKIGTMTREKFEPTILQIGASGCDPSFVHFNIHFTEA